MVDREETDPLDKLFHSGTSVDRTLLAGLLDKRIRIYPEEGAKGIVFEIKSFTARHKILLYLLARKAMKLRDPSSLEGEEASPKEIETDLGINGGTVRPALRQLADDHLVRVNANSKYLVSNHDLDRIERELTRKEKET